MPLNKLQFKQYSAILHKDMNILVYGNRKAFPILVIPSQDGVAFDYENFNMVSSIRKYIDENIIQLFCIDTIDQISFSNINDSVENRIRNQIKYRKYVMDEVIPFIRKINTTKCRILLTGCSLGGYHSANFFFSYPDIFEGFISLSGIFDARLLLNSQPNIDVDNNSPIHILANSDEKTLNKYRDRSIYCCVGRGRWEEEGLQTQPILEKLLCEKNIPHFADYWGYDVDHDWGWWQKQIVYFLPMALKDIKKHYPKIIKQEID